MSDFNFVTDARLAAGSYSSNNQNNTQVIDGWKPLQLLSSTGEPISEGTFSQTFGAQLYEKGGQYKVVFRGTEGNVSDWVQNLKYGTFQWSDEFRDAVAFMAKAIKIVAGDDKFGGDVRKAASYFTTTGHSQGGFQAELAALMFGVKGTSLDGMGAMGVAQQFRAELNKVMEENGVSDLIRTDEKLSLNSTDFQTRIYTAVGRLGVHAGETDGAWSWTATKMMLIFNPALAGIAVGGGFVAHPSSSIVANEEKRVSSPLWKLIGDASDTTDPLYLTMAKACKYNKPSSRLMPPMIPYLTMNTLSS